MAKKKTVLSIEERLQQALVPKEEQPYEVPENWVWTRLGYVSEIVTGGTPSKKHSEYYGDDVPFYKPADLDSGRCVYNASEYLSIEGKKVSRLIPQYSTAVCCIGSIGKCGFLLQEGTTNQQINSIISKLEPLLMYYYACSDIFQKELSSKASATTIAIVNKTKMEQCLFTLPPIPEQQRIVARIEELFAKLDEAKENLQEVIDGFETRKAAILHKAFTGELTKKWREEHVVGMDSWEDSLLKDVCDVNPKKVDTKNLSDQLSVSFIPMAAVSDVNGCITEPLVKPLGEVKKGFTNFCEGDIILAKITPCMENGKSAVVGKLVNDIGFGSTEFYVLRTSVKLYNNYLYHIVRSSSFRDLAKGEMTGAVGQQRVPKSFIENFTIKLPRLDEQQEIVRIVDSLLEKEQKAKEAAKSVLEQIDLMKKSILARAFRGELGTNDPAEPSSMELLKQVLAEAQ